MRLAPSASLRSAPPPREEDLVSTQPKKSDLPVRTASAVVMIAVAGTALWLGGVVWMVFVAAVGFGVFFEWARLILQGFKGPLARIFWIVSGVIYVGGACGLMLVIGIADAEVGRQMAAGATYGFAQSGRAGVLLPLIASVVATDIGAYFVGRTIGGPKLAPRISPGKTWSGLIGGMLAAAPAYASATWYFDSDWSESMYFKFLVVGALAAIVAQCGDLFESWLKRRANVKDSGGLLPGHGGLFDRVDGLLAVLFVASLTLVISFIEMLSLSKDLFSQ